MKVKPLAQLARRLTPLRGTDMHDPADIPTPDELKNAKLLRFEAPFGSLGFGGAPSFFALFAIQLGASNTVVGWLSSGPALISLLWMMPCGRLIQRAHSYAYPLALGASLHRVLLILLALVPFLPAEWRSLAMVGLVALSSLPSAAWGLSWQAAAAEMFPPSRFARYIGQVYAIANICNVMWTLLLGKWVDSVTFPLNFQIMFAGVGLFTVTSAWLALRLRLPPRRPSQLGSDKPKPPLRALLSQWQRHRAFALFEVGILVAHLAAFSAAPLLRIYWVRDLHAAGGWVGALTAAFLFGASIGNLMWSRWSRPERLRQLILVTVCASWAGNPLLTAAFGSLAPLIGVGILAGFFDGGIGLSFLNRLMQLAPRDQRPTFIAMHSIVVNIAAFVGPLIGTALTDIWGTRTVLAMTGGLGLAGAALLYALGWGHTPDKADGTT